MLKRTGVALFVMLPFISQAQTAYDSLKKVYHAQYIFEQREKGDSYKFIQAEINSITNPELKQLAACAIASNVYGYGFVDNKKLVSLVDDVIAAPNSQYVKTVAINTKEELERTLVNSKILPIRLPSPTGDTLNLADYYTGKFDYTIVDLWATWCGPCIAEMKKFNDLRKRYAIEFYSISLDDDITKVQKFVKRNPDYTWPIVFAGKDSTLWNYFNVRLIPAFVIVDKNGMIVSHLTGKGLEEKIKQLYKP